MPRPVGFRIHKTHPHIIGLYKFNSQESLRIIRITEPYVVVLKVSWKSIVLFRSFEKIIVSYS